MWCCNSKNLVATFYAIVGLRTHTQTKVTYQQGTVFDS